MSKIEIAKKTDVDAVEAKVDSLHQVAKTGDYNDLNNKPSIPSKVEKTSELQNDSGFITAGDIPDVEVPTKNSQLENDKGYITSNDIPAPPSVPTKLSELENDKDFITANDIPSVDVPTKNSQLENDSGFITGVTASDVAASVGGMGGNNVEALIVELKSEIEALKALLEPEEPEVEG